MRSRRLDTCIFLGVGYSHLPDTIIPEDDSILVRLYNGNLIVSEFIYPHDSLLHPINIPLDFNGRKIIRTIMNPLLNT